MYNSIVARSFSQHGQKKMRRGAFFGGLVLGFFICIYSTPYQGPLAFGKYIILTSRTKLFSCSSRLVKYSDSRADVTTPVKSRIVCNFTEPESDFCEMHGDIRILGSSSTIFIPHFSVADMFTKNNSSGIKPYARKSDEGALERVRQFRFSQEMHRCTQNHSVPTVLFSIGEYTGNYFHSFSDVVIPLYTTSRKFNGQVQFLLADKKVSWTKKFRVVLMKLSNYEAIDIDKEDGVHCFPGMIIGLKKHKELSIDPLESPDYSMTNFREFLRSSYYLKREYAIRLGSKGKKRPRLLIISRKRTRTFMNENEIGKMAQKLGFDVVLAEASSNISEFSKLVNSCDVLMGVHGAGLTNIVFLPKNAVLIQVVLFGGVEWLATTYFGDPSKNMNLRYLEYKISEKESSLIQKYPLDDEVFKNPQSIAEKGWPYYKSVYLDNQNVKLDVFRFKTTLLEALQMLSM
ncbi:hypothetical protein DCAR_0415649 [Daucus carota subsp. sativus]|uniref:Glycosyltransferase 61 catalytic domain-containing protein n=1 Tax=Daucus carota subsp. sativus TaxID=79200 RepID=A0AAF1AVC8_DAUCS|nr:hypothetical protein DCAR_0415649 [Daucus carota subsp. sativus]